MADVDRCVVCGAPVPEGRMVCPGCERGSTRPNLALLETVMPGITAEVEPLLEAARKEKKR